MEFIKTEFEGLIEIIPNFYGDERGYFIETFSENIFKENDIAVNFVQDNQSMSHKGVLRGLHFQNPPYGQDKLVRVITGSVLDVVVDIRKDSSTFGQHKIFILDSEKKNILFIPVGFAHGFKTLENNTIFSYKCSGYYNKNSENGLPWDDADLAINWDLSEKPIISEKDKNWQPFKHFESPF